MKSPNPNSIHEKNPDFCVFSCLRSIFICLCLCSKIGLWSKIRLREKIRLIGKRLFQALFFAERHRSEMRETRILSRSLNR